MRFGTVMDDATVYLAKSIEKGKLIDKKQNVFRMLVISYLKSLRY